MYCRVVVTELLLFLLGWQQLIPVLSESSLQMFSWNREGTEIASGASHVWACNQDMPERVKGSGQPVSSWSFAHILNSCEMQVRRKGVSAFRQVNFTYILHPVVP